MSILLLGPALAAGPCPEVFATEVVDHHLGPGVEPEWGQVDNALGAPDFDEGRGAVSLGNHTGGDAWIELAFAQPIVDGKGPDLHIYERGPSAEPTLVEVSVDGREWFTVGRVEGSVRQVDLGMSLELEGRKFWFLRLTGVNGFARGPWAGPDIDAVGLLNSCPVPNS